ncbi:TPA: AAA family ATPase [Streptococcus suis]|nr:AAA family ATPase [Streptococcus suis]
MLLLNQFKINNLNRNCNVDLQFSDSKTIFIGENGVGKTTILSILYYLLKLDFKELSRFNFESLELSLEDNRLLSITRNDIIEELSRSGRRNPRLNFELDEYVNEIKKNEKLLSSLKQSDSNGYSDYRKINAFLTKEIGLPSVSPRFRDEIIAELLYQINPPQYKPLLDKIKKINEKFNILYFPTYRRIEENLVRLDLPTKEDRINQKNSGELIHFGMEDVKERIFNLLNKISKETNESYNAMTSGLLNTFAEGELKVSSEEFDKDTIDIALSRLGNKVTKKSKKKILDKVSSGKLKEDRYLNYLVSSIIDNYKQLEEIDSRINNFTKRVNKYLFNKKFFYDAEKLKLEIKRTNSNGEIKVHKDFFGEDEDEIIDLGNLSSGEKQLVSTFSKIFLEDEKEMLVLFDEPELSLSVPWQKEFIYDISQADTCKFLLVVTHSPFIYDKLLDYAKEIDKYMYESGSYYEDARHWKHLQSNEFLFEDEFPF